MSMKASRLLGARAPSPALSAQREQSSRRRKAGRLRRVAGEGARVPSINGRVSDVVSSQHVSVLPDDHVHVWRVPLNHSSEDTTLSLDVLSPDERKKAARFRFAKDKNQFVQARAALRFILGQYLNVTPQDLEFSYGHHGKPALANGEASLRFNLSHRDGLALIAVTRGREIGVDVELVRADVPVFEIADVSFSSAESATLHGLPESLRAKGFYNCWTRKEAYVKARGEGLSFPLKQFDVSLTPGDPAKLLRVGDDDNEIDRWTLQEIPASENYVAALAVEGTDLNVTCRDWNLSQ
jgi:4'-phosphopantetheinyl transferase